MIPVGLSLVVATVFADRIDHGFIYQLYHPQGTVAVGGARNFGRSGGFHDRF